MNHTYQTLKIYDINVSKISNLSFHSNNQITFFIEDLKSTFLDSDKKVEFSACVTLSADKIFEVDILESSVALDQSQIKFKLHKKCIDQIRTFLVKRVENFYGELTEIFHNCDSYFSNKN